MRKQQLIQATSLSTINCLEPKASILSASERSNNCQRRTEHQGQQSGRIKTVTTMTVTETLEVCY